MATGPEKSGPYAEFPDGYCQAARGVISSGHVRPTPTAHWARNALIDPSRGPEDREGAFAALETLIEGQITEPCPVPGIVEDARGTWSWSVGDTGGTGPAPNMEDFLGTAFLQTLRHDAVADHSDWPEGLFDRLRRCLIDAVRCSARRRVRVSYTNPLAMSIQCAALTGEMFGVQEFVEFTRERLAEWVAFTDKAGTFEEFNSSTYGGVTLPHTATLVEHVRDADIRAKALYMERKYFDHVCDFYHHPTGEVCMPRSRAYRDRFAGTGLQRYLSVILARRRPGAFPKPKDSPALQAIQYSHATDEQIDRLPEAFADPRETRVFAEWIGCDHVGWVGEAPPPARGTPTRRRQLVAWRAAAFCVGSVNEIDSWEQRRSVGGYVRTGGGSAMVAWKPLIEVAGTSAKDQQIERLKHRWPTLMYFNLCSGQVGGTVLAGLTAVPVDGQWLCGSHWRQKVAGAVEGVSLDLGFDLDGLDEDAELPAIRTGEPWRLEVGECTVSLLFMGGHVGDTPAEPILRRPGQSWRISLLREEDLTLDFSAPPEVALAFVLDISPAGRAPKIGEGSWSVRGTRLDCAATVGGKRLTLRYDPPKLGDLTRQACLFDAVDA